MKTTFHWLCVLASVCSITACTAKTSEEEGSSQQKLLIKVTLPKHLGGGTRYTSKAPHYKPKKKFPFGATIKHHPPGAPSSLPTGPVGESADLSDGAPEPGDQGQTSSCATWATGYSAMGWWAAKQGLPGAPYAPMFLYGQLVNGNCEEGTDIGASLQIMQKQGIPSDGAYQPMQQELDCSPQTLSSETKADAVQHRIAAFENVDLTDPVTALKQQLAANRPVVLGIEIYNNFQNATGDALLIGAPEEGEQSQGGHAITAFGYDDKGVWILNSWGTSWGSSGWAQLSWEFLSGKTPDGTPNLGEADVITGVVGGTASP